MIYGLYNSAAGMLTSEYRQAVLANNIANADTVGFRRDIATFAERVPARVAGIRHGASAVDLAGLSGGMWLGETFTDHTAGTTVATGNPYDVALDGPGFLAVEVDGQTLYTRDGRMTRRSDGLLVAASDGAPILGRGGMPIRLNPQGGDISVDTQGRVQQDGAIVGELELVDFADYGTLRKAGAARFTGPAEGTAEAAVLVQAGYVESASVQPVNELVSMIQAAHAYQMNARMIALQDESAGKLINVVLRT